MCVESPLRGDTDELVARNVMYADACQLDCLRRGEAPFLGHLQYPRVLNDAHFGDREKGIGAHIAWLRASELVAVYTDLGVTDGMLKAIAVAESIGLRVERRSLGREWHVHFLAETHATGGFFS